MKDKTVQDVIDKFQQRSETGIKKYGTTLEENEKDDFLNHLQEELMDAVLYIEKLKSVQIEMTYLRDQIECLEIECEELTEENRRLTVRIQEGC